PNSGLTRSYTFQELKSNNRANWLYYAVNNFRSIADCIKATSILFRKRRKLFLLRHEQKLIAEAEYLPYVYVRETPVFRPFFISFVLCSAICNRTLFFESVNRATT